MVTEEDVTFKSLLPCVQCGIHELPDSDGKLHLLQSEPLVACCVMIKF